MKSSIKGFSLLEVIIAVLVLSSALLAMSYLQVLGLRNANSAYVRSQATMLGYDIVDRMRANAADAPSYVIAIGTATPAATAVLSRIDTIDWRTNIAAALPSGRGGVALASGVATVTITWFDNSQEGTGSQPTTQTYTYSARL